MKWIMLGSILIEKRQKYLLFLVDRHSFQTRNFPKSNLVHLQPPANSLALVTAQFKGHSNFHRVISCGRNLVPIMCPKDNDYYISSAFYGDI